MFSLKRFRINSICQLGDTNKPILIFVRYEELTKKSRLEMLLPVAVCQCLLLNASITATNESDLSINRHSARECTVFARAQFLRKCHEQRPSNKYDLDFCEMGVEIVKHGDEPAFDFISLP
jgi:hypothetical protein